MSRTLFSPLGSSQLGAILWAKQRIVRHTLASVQRESKLKVAFVSISAVALWLGIFLLSWSGFGLLGGMSEQALGVGALRLSDLVMARLLSVFALALFVMLIFSNVLIAYSTLYRSREVTHQLQSPITTATFFLGRFYECVTFSSWASAFLGSPVLLAYGLETGAPPVFYLALVAFYLPFVTIPAALGSLITVIVVRVVVAVKGSRLHRGVWLGLAGVLLLALLGFFRGRIEVPSFVETPSLQAVVETLGRTQSPFLPSFWVSQGLLGTATGDLGAGLFHWLLLVSNALFLVWLATLAAERWFYAGWTALGDGAGVRRARNGRGILDRFDAFLRPLPPPVRSLVSKDFKLFWRDPAQWSQFVLFFGIMALYVANIRGARSFTHDESWRALGTLLNLGAAMLILASLTTRFIYPLVSLEGRRFWIIGLAPVTLRQIMWQKFWLSVGSTSVFTVSLAVLSGWQLGLDRTAFALSVAGIVATTFALSGLAVGLGSLYPNFEEENPARIVSGLGGTLNFLLSMLFIALIGAGQAAVLLWGRLAAFVGEDAYPWVVATAVAWMIVLTAVTCLVPLRLGLANLERAEF
ncbi:MAG: hypothetical protein GY719_01705 [bacterium]|nr:hypothetical protein [bacterium]